MSAFMRRLIALEDRHVADTPPASPPVVMLCAFNTDPHRATVGGVTLIRQPGEARDDFTARVGAEARQQHAQAQAAAPDTVVLMPMATLHATA